LGDDAGELPDGGVRTDDAVEGRRVLLALLRRGLEHQLHAAGGQRGVEGDLSLEQARTTDPDPVGAGEIRHAEVVLAAAHLEVAGGEEAVVDPHLVLLALAHGEGGAVEADDPLALSLADAELCGAEASLVLGVSTPD